MHRMSDGISAQRPWRALSEGGQPGHCAEIWGGERATREACQAGRTAPVKALRQEHSGVFRISQIASLPGTEQDMKEQWGERREITQEPWPRVWTDLNWCGSQWRVLRREGTWSDFCAKMLPLAAVLRICPKLVRMETGDQLANSCRFGVGMGRHHGWQILGNQNCTIPICRAGIETQMQRTDFQTQGRRGWDKLRE